MTDPPAPEFVLVAACTRWPPSAVRNTAIRAAAAAVRDWHAFLPLLRRHRVAGLAQAALTAANVSLPPGIAAELAARAQRIARHNLLLAAESLRLQGLLAAAGIKSLILKGAALAQLAYSSHALKQTRDIDLLVLPRHAEVALQLLEREGYVLQSPAPHLSTAQRRALIRFGREAELHHPGSKLVVELQWRATDNPLLLRGVDANAYTQDVVLPNTSSLRTLGRDDLFAYLCVHGAHHSWSRLKWLADANALIGSNDSTIAAFYRHAKAIGAGLCAAQMLVLCQRFLAMPLPPELSDAFASDRRVATLASIAEAAIAAPTAETEGDGSLASLAQYMRTQFLLGRGAAFYAAQIRIAVIVPVDAIRVPLPPILQFLYPLLRLPLWLQRRANVRRASAHRALSNRT